LSAAAEWIDEDYIGTKRIFEFFLAMCGADRECGKAGNRPGLKYAQVVRRWNGG
jgi:hypothetical protein